MILCICCWRIGRMLRVADLGGHDCFPHFGSFEQLANFFGLAAVHSHLAPPLPLPQEAESRGRSSCPDCDEQNRHDYGGRNPPAGQNDQPPHAPAKAAAIVTTVRSVARLNWKRRREVGMGLITYYGRNDPSAGLRIPDKVVAVLVWLHVGLVGYGIFAGPRR